MNFLEKFLEDLRKKVGVDLLGLVKAEDLSLVRERILESKAKGYTTSFEIENINKRTKPEDLLENCKSIFVIGLSYYWEGQSKGDYLISSYARGLDYHQVLKKLKDLEEILSRDYSFSALCHVDTGGFYEKELGIRAGFGYLGKNSLLINKDLGSYFFLGCLFTSIDFSSYSSPSVGTCGSCNRCLKACPAQAIKGDYSVDFSRCHSYITQKKEYHKELENINYAYGCDICQEVCPKNSNIKKNLHQEFRPRIFSFDNEDIFSLSNKAFKRKYKDFAFSWVNKKVIERNIEILKKRD